MIEGTKNKSEQTKRNTKDVTKFTSNYQNLQMMQLYKKFRRYF